MNLFYFIKQKINMFYFEDKIKQRHVLDKRHHSQLLYPLSLCGELFSALTSGHLRSDR